MAKEIEDPELVLHWHFDPAATGASAVPGLVNPNGAGAFGNLAQNVPQTPVALQIGGSVPADEVWELAADPVITFDGGGLQAGVAPQDFSLQALLDQGNGQQGTAAPWGYWRGAPDLNPDVPGMWAVDAPAVPSMDHAGMLAAVRAARNPNVPLADIIAIAAKTYKVASTFSFTITPLGGAVSSIIDLKWYGRRWSKQAFAKYLQGQSIGGTYSAARSVEGLAVNFPLSFPALDFSTWTQQPGGGNQGTTQVWPYRTVAIQTVQSTLNTDLLLAWNGGQSGQAQVENSNENLDFRYNPRTDTNNLLDVDSWGVRTRWQYLTGAGTNLRGTAIYAESDVVAKYHPEYGRLVTDTDNPYGFGYQQGFGPSDNRSRRVPKFRFPVFGDHISFVLRDNGTGTLAANTIATAVRGTMIVKYPFQNGTVTRNGQAV